MKPIKPLSRHGNWTVVGPNPVDSADGYDLIVRCDCGHEKPEESAILRAGLTTKCGPCLAGKVIEVPDLKNRRFDRLTVRTKCDAPSADGQDMWRCVCVCGEETEASTGSLMLGDAKCCSLCAYKERKTKRAAKAETTERIWGRDVSVEEAAGYAGVSVPTYRDRKHRGMTAEQAVSWPRGKKLPPAPPGRVVPVAAEPPPGLSVRDQYRWRLGLATTGTTTEGAPVRTEEEELAMSLEHAPRKSKWEIAFKALSGSIYLKAIARQAVRAIEDEVAAALERGNWGSFGALAHSDAQRVSAILDVTHVLEAGDSELMRTIAERGDLDVLAPAILARWPEKEEQRMTRLERAALHFVNREREKARGAA